MIQDEHKYLEHIRDTYMLIREDHLNDRDLECYYKLGRLIVADAEMEMERRMMK